VSHREINSASNQNATTVDEAVAKSIETAKEAIVSRAALPGHACYAVVGLPKSGKSFLVAALRGLAEKLGIEIVDSEEVFPETDASKPFEARALETEFRTMRRVEEILARGDSVLVDKGEFVPGDFRFHNERALGRLRYIAGAHGAEFVPLFVGTSPETAAKRFPRKKGLLAFFKERRLVEELRETRRKLERFCASSGDGRSL